AAWRVRTLHGTRGGMVVGSQREAPHHGYRSGIEHQTYHRAADVPPALEGKHVRTSKGRKTRRILAPRFPPVFPLNLPETLLLHVLDHAQLVLHAAIERADTNDPRPRAKGNRNEFVGPAYCRESRGTGAASGNRFGRVHR